MGVIEKATLRGPQGDYQLCWGYRPKPHFYQLPAIVFFPDTSDVQMCKWENVFHRNLFGTNV